MKKEGRNRKPYSGDEGPRRSSSFTKFITGERDGEKCVRGMGCLLEQPLLLLRWQERSGKSVSLSFQLGWFIPLGGCSWDM